LERLPRVPDPPRRPDLPRSWGLLTAAGHMLLVNSGLGAAL
jgi:hypothetical protein